MLDFNTRFKAVSTQKPHITTQICDGGGYDKGYQTPPGHSWADSSCSSRYAIPISCCCRYPRALMGLIGLG